MRRRWLGHVLQKVGLRSLRLCLLCFPSRVAFTNVTALHLNLKFTRVFVIQHCAHHTLFAWRRWQAYVARLKLPRRAWLHGRRSAGVAKAIACADSATRRRRAAAFAAWRHRVSSVKVQLSESAAALAVRREAMVRTLGKTITRRLLLRPRWVKWCLVCAALRGIRVAAETAGQGLHEVSVAISVIDAPIPAPYDRE